ncbi:hypothetical protein DFJ73DRAFT_764146 [Zopfochytrium polystomum]|nr:hypothetical protein DFJ73DRAFT_764146 [Zopfochytrium polystomum]
MFLTLPVQMNTVKSKIDTLHLPQPHFAQDDNQYKPHQISETARVTTLRMNGRDKQKELIDTIWSIPSTLAFDESLLLFIVKEYWFFWQLLEFYSKNMRISASIPNAGKFSWFQSAHSSRVGGDGVGNGWALTTQSVPQACVFGSRAFSGGLHHCRAGGARQVGNGGVGQRWRGQIAPSAVTAWETGLSAPAETAGGWGAGSRSGRSWGGDGRSRGGRGGAARAESPATVAGAAGGGGLSNSAVGNDGGNISLNMKRDSPCK